jgi:hypothetical protein
MLEAPSRKSNNHRRLRFRMRDAAQRLTNATGVQKCGRSVAALSGFFRAGPELRVSTSGDGAAFFTGLMRCSSVWECPVCAPRVQSGRAAELRALNRGHAAAGGGLYMATLTLPHRVGDRLKPMRKHVARSWQRVIAGAPWKRWRARLELEGTVRALETTVGPNGWHCHLHVALYTRAPLAPGELAELRAWLFQRWVTFVTKPAPSGERYAAPSAEHGVRVDALRESEYLAKMGLAHELATSSTKEGRAGHRTPFQVLRDLTLAPAESPARAADVRLWREWARGIRGARQLTYSRGLKKLAARYAVELAENDAALESADADEQLFPADGSELVHTFTADEWRALVTSRRSVAARLQLLELPATVPRLEWRDAVVRVLDWALGLEPVPF